jgi:hypothetical protein
VNSATAGVLDGLRGPLRRLFAVGLGALAAGLGLLALAAAAWAFRVGLVRDGAWVLLAWMAALGLVTAVLRAARRRAPGLSRTGLAARLEESGAARRGGLTGLLAVPAGGTSSELLDRADELEAERLEAAAGPALARYRRELREAALRGGAVLGVGALLLGAARPLRAPADRLFHPARAWAAITAPIRLEASATVVDQGGSVRFTVRAPGAGTVEVRHRAPGETWSTLTLEPAAGVAEFTLGPLEADVFAVARRGGRASDTVHVAVRIPAFLGSLAVTAHYPAYLGLEPEPLPLGGDSLVLPAGTRLVTEGAATLELAEAAWLGGTGRHDLRTRGMGFQGEFTPASSGLYRLALRTRSGAPLAGDSVQLRVVLLADRVPAAAIPVPGADTIAPASLRLGLVLDARDDYGLAALRVVSRRVTGLGVADTPVSLVVELPPGAPAQALVPVDFTLEDRGLLPGDTVRYWAEAVDNSPRRQVGRSREYRLRIPTRAELRDATRGSTAALQARLDSLALQSRAVERATEDLAREQLRTEGGARGSRNEPLSYRDAQRAGEAAEAQEAMLRQAEELQEALDELREAAERAGLDDPAFQARLEEIRDQLQRALSPELRERLEELRRAIADLDAPRAREALQQMAEAQKELREALERSRELFRRAALEGDLAALEREARELAEAARMWADRQARIDSARAAAEADRLAGRTDSLAAGLERAAGQQRAEAGQDTTAAGRLDRAAAGAERSAERLRSGRQAALRGQRPEGRARGEEAAQELGPVGDEVEQARREMAEAWRDEVAAAMDRTLAETSELTDRQLAVERALRDGGDPARARLDQAAVEEGVRQLAEQAREAAGRNALVPPRIAGALEAARREMQRTRETLSQGPSDPRGAAQSAARATELLTNAAYQLLRAREDVSSAESGSGLEEAMERMAEMARQQGQMAAEANGLLPSPIPGPGFDAELKGLAGRQRALAEQLERMRGEGQLAGAGEFAREAEELARRLEAGRLDRQTVERQERLFRRMLDAGRTLEGEEKDEKKERQSTTATEVDPRLPPALRTRLLGEGLQMPSWEELQRLTPEERKVVIDYFRRLTQAGP